GCTAAAMEGAVFPAAPRGVLLARVLPPFHMSEWLPISPGSTFDLELPRLKQSLFTLGGGSTASDVGFETLLMLIFMFVVVVIAVIAMTKAQRRIPMQSAKHVRGRRVFGGTRNYLPLKDRKSTRLNSSH